MSGIDADRNNLRLTFALLAYDMALCHIHNVSKDEFKRLRQSAGHTQMSLAKAFGVHLRTVARWELGEIKIPTVVELALRYVAEKAGKKKRGR